jgi:molecular chaperone GrpE
VKRDERVMGQDEREPREEFKVEDRRHWTAPAPDPETEAEAPAETDRPRAAAAETARAEQAEQRAAQAEAKLQEYVSAFRRHQQEQEAFRARMQEDVDRKVELRFGQLAADLLETLDDLDRGLAHVESAADPLARGLTMARGRFLATLERHGVEAIVPDGQPFDPHIAEAVRVDPVDSGERDGAVTETLAPGYRLGDRVIRAARVAVGRLA